MKNYKIEVTGTGGEWTAGIVKDKEVKEALLDLKERDELNFDNDYEENEDLEVNAFSYDDICHIYGQNIDEDNIEITYSRVEEEEDEESYGSEYKEIGEEIVINDPKSITFYNPYINKLDYPDATGEEIIFMGYTLEKGMTSGYLLELEDDQEINEDYILFSTILMDELFQFNDNILNEVYYFDKDNFISWIKKEINEDTLEAKCLKEEYEKYKDDLEKEYSDIYSEFVGEVKYNISLKKNESSSKTEPFLYFSNFMLEQISDPEGYQKSNEAFLFNLEAEEL